MTLRLSLIAHAATAAQRASTFPMDEPIEPGSETPAARSARVDRVLVSPELRARETAALLGLTGEPAAELRDCDYGRWAGCSLETVQSTEPDALVAWLADPEARPHGGESVAQLIRRVAGWLDRQATQGGRMIAVVHPAIIRAAILHAIAAPASSYRHIDVKPLSEARLSHDGRYWRFQSLMPPDSRQGPA
jgi:broad specificity phosphatase PhoE